MHTLSHAWYSIQRTLFPFIEEESGPLSEPLKKLVATLELVRIEEFIPAAPVRMPGRPPASRRALARAFVAKDLPTTRTLIDMLTNSPMLRRICGWERQADIPDEATSWHSTLHRRCGSRSAPPPNEETLDSRTSSAADSCACADTSR